LTKAEKDKMAWIFLFFLLGNIALFWALGAFVDNYKDRMQNVPFGSMCMAFVGLLGGWLGLWRRKARQALQKTAWARHELAAGGNRREEAQTEKSQIGKSIKKSWFVSPLSSPEVREIATHLTKEERNEAALHGLLWGLWVVTVTFGNMWIIRSFPAPGCWIVAAVITLLFLASLPPWFRMQRRFLYSTTWAKAQGYTAEQVNLFSFSRQTLWRVLLFAGVASLLIIGQSKLFTHLSGVDELSKSLKDDAERTKEQMARLASQKKVHTPATYPGDWIWEMNSSTLNRVPPIFLLRPTIMPTNWVPGEMFGNGRYLARGKTVKELIATVWSQKNSALKIVFAAKLPEDKFDFIVTAQPHWWDSLQTEIDRRFHLVEQIDNQDGTDVVMVKSASLTEAEPPKLSFGQVVERVLPDQLGGQGPFMNFESGELVVAPNGLVENRFDRTLLIDWLVKAGADASAIAGENGGHQLVSYTRDTCFSEVSPSSWERMNESGLLHAWQLAARTNRIVLGNPDLLPRTFVFETRTGIHGLLQITGFTDNPRGVKIRYKLVQQAGGQISIAGEKRQTADEEIARLKLQAAEQDVKTPEARFAVGTITTNELQKARLARDIAAAETKGDSVEIARLKLQVADLDLDVAAKMSAVGTITKEEYTAAKLARDEAAVYFRAAQKADDKLVQTPAPTPSVPPGYQQGQPVPLPSGYERGQEVPLPPAYKPVQNAGTAKINPAATPDQLADLKARLDAARGILAFPNRDAALAVVARDAAKAGIIQTVRDALGQMTAFPVRDKAALESARELLIAGRRAEAIEIAKTITSFTQRDAALKALAQ
jgi:hypothetical protein